MYTDVYICIYAYICIYIYVYMYICIYIYMCVYMHICIYMHMCIYSKTDQGMKLRKVHECIGTLCMYVYMYV